MRSESMPGRPAFSVEAARELLAREWRVEGLLTSLPSHSDQNFKVEVPNESGFVVRIANAKQSRAFSDALVSLLRHIEPLGLGTQVVVPTVGGEGLCSVAGEEGARHQVMVTRWIEGRTLATERRRGPQTMRSFGRFLARLDAAIEHFDAPGLHRDLDWDLVHGTRVIAAGKADLESSSWAQGADRLELFQAAISDHLARYEPLLQLLPRATVHNDPNDHNVLVAKGGDASDGPKIVGILDFGDAVHSLRIADLAIGATYAMLDSPTPVQVLKDLTRGYTESRELTDLESHLLLPLIRLRLLVSVTKSAQSALCEPDNEYLMVSQEGAWRALRQMATMDFDAVATLVQGSKRPPPVASRAPLDPSGLRDQRERLIGASLSLAYDEPLTIVRGWGQYLFDTDGRAYLDCVNNVCHVGHSHPRVVKAIRDQAELLNTNSRYLHPIRVEYAKRLLETLPAELDTCFFVSSGSEANELALRIAKAATGRDQVVVLESGYHGSTSALAELSPYKFDGPGGPGRPDHVHVAPIPDTYRGRCRDADQATDVYLKGLVDALERASEQGGPAAFFAESIPSCAGQIVPPPGYTRTAFAAAQAAGAIAIADEVQSGFGRVGSKFWAFELDGARPDIVTMGKPMGNGHPLGAVVTRRALADAFANGMEYFATFGGNPVSCAAGLAVLDVLRDDGLQDNALRTGDLLLSRLRELAGTDPRLGDVRGHGLFVGVEFVRPRSDRSPDAELAHAVVQHARRAGVLLSSDGPDHNVIKIKPPLVFTAANVKTLVDAVRGGLGSRPQ